MSIIIRSATEGGDHFFSFLVISSDSFSIRADPTREGRGVSLRVPYYFSRGVGSRHDSLIWDPIPPPRSNPGPTGGLQERILFYRGWIGRPDCPTFAPQHSPMLAPASKLPRARVDRGRADCRSWMPTARLTGRSAAISGREQEEAMQDRGIEE